MSLGTLREVSASIVVTSDPYAHAEPFSKQAGRQNAGWLPSRPCYGEDEDSTEDRASEDQREGSADGGHGGINIEVMKLLLAPGQVGQPVSSQHHGRKATSADVVKDVVGLAILVDDQGDTVGEGSRDFGSISIASD